MICPQCGMSWDSRPYICDCGFALGSAVAKDDMDNPREPPQATARQTNVLGQDPTALRQINPNAARFLDGIEPGEEPVGGFLFIAIAWLCLLVTSAAYTWLEVRAIVTDQTILGNLNQMGMISLVEFLKAADILNGAFLILGVAMLIAVLVARRYARALVISFLLANVLLVIVDYEMTKEVMSGSAGHVLDIDPELLVPRLLGRLAGSTILLVYFFISKRVEKTFK